MTLNAAIEAELPYLRAEALARMTSTVTVRRLSDRADQDEDNGLELAGYEVVYAGPFRLGGSERGGAGSRTLDVGGVEVQVATRVGHFPHDTTGLADGDLIDVTAGENAGLVLRIVEAAWQDQSTARRVPVVETQRPEWPEWA